MQPSTESGRDLPETAIGAARDAGSQDLVNLMASGETLVRDRLVEVPRREARTNLLPTRGSDASRAASDRNHGLRRMRTLQRAMLATTALLATVLLLPLLPAGPGASGDRWVEALEQSSAGNLRGAMETLYAHERSLPESATGRRAMALMTMSEHAAVLGHATQATLLAVKAATVAGAAPAEASETVLPAMAAASTLAVEGGFETAAQRRADEVARLRVASIVGRLPALR